MPAQRRQQVVAYRVRVITAHLAMLATLLGELPAQAAEQPAGSQTVVTGTRPTPEWGCEVFDEASGQRTECTVGAVTPRGAGFFITAILLPRWFDAAKDAKLRLSPR